MTTAPGATVVHLPDGRAYLNTAAEGLPVRDAGAALERALRAEVDVWACDGLVRTSFHHDTTEGDIDRCLDVLERRQAAEGRATREGATKA